MNTKTALVIFFYNSAAHNQPFFNLLLKGSRYIDHELSMQQRKDDIQLIDINPNY